MCLTIASPRPDPPAFLDLLLSTLDTNPIEVFHWGDSQIEGDRHDIR